MAWSFLHWRTALFDLVFSYGWLSQPVRVLSLGLLGPLPLPEADLPDGIAGALAVAADEIAYLVSHWG